MREDAFTYPTDRENWATTVLLGGILTFLGFLLVPLFVVEGYVVRAIRTSIDGDAAPPAFEDWEALLVDGVKAWLVGVVYLLVPAVVGMVTVGGAIIAIATGDPGGAVAGVAGLFGGMALTAVLTLAFGYVATAAIVNFASEGRFGAAFEFGRLREITLSAAFAVAWVVSLVAFVVAGVVASVPLVGWVLAPFVGFYAAVVAARLLAGGYVDATGDRETSAGVESGRPAT